jgi:hypothetical protein
MANPFLKPITDNFLAKLIPKILEAGGIAKPPYRFRCMIIDREIVPTLPPIHLMQRDEFDADVAQLAKKLEFDLSIPEHPVAGETAQQRQERQEHQRTCLIDICNEHHYLSSDAQGRLLLILVNMRVADTLEHALSRQAGLAPYDIQASAQLHANDKAPQQLANFLLLERACVIITSSFSVTGEPHLTPQLQSAQEINAHATTSFNMARKVWLEAGGNPEIVERLRAARILSCYTRVMVRTGMNSEMAHMQLDHVHPDYVQINQRRIMYGIIHGITDSKALLDATRTMSSQDMVEVLSKVSVANPKIFGDIKTLWKGAAQLMCSVVDAHFGGNLEQHRQPLALFEAQIERMRMPANRASYPPVLSEAYARGDDRGIMLALLTRLNQSIQMLNPAIAISAAAASGGDAYLAVRANMVLTQYAEFTKPEAPIRPTSARPLSVAEKAMFDSARPALNAKPS